MLLLDGIESRTSAAKLAEPAPNRDQLTRIIAAGTRAPDHGRLRPWRFVVLQGDARGKLGDAMAQMLLAKMPAASPDQLEGERRKPLRAPLIVAVAAHIAKGKIPEIEQIVAVGAAIQNMLLGAQALGFGAMWKTGGAAYDVNVKQMLGFEPEDHIVGFVYLGTTVVPGPLVPAPMNESVLRWL